MKRLVWSIAGALILAAPIASASNAFVTGDVTLRAGPDEQYPTLDVIPGGAPINVYGCVDNYDWCDVGTRGERGWVYGDYVQFNYDNRRVLVREYGPRFGIPIISFNIGTYWDSYYRTRPFYGQRITWYSRPTRYYNPSRYYYNGRYDFHRAPSRVVPLPQPYSDRNHDGNPRTHTVVPDRDHDGNPRTSTGTDRNHDGDPRTHTVAGDRNHDGNPRTHAPVRDTRTTRTVVRDNGNGGKVVQKRVVNERVVKKPESRDERK